MHISRVIRIVPVSLAACIVVTLLLPHGAAGQDGHIDTVYLNGKVVTVDADFTIAEAFVVRGDKFVAVGDSASIRRLAEKTTRIIDLRGNLVLPGMIDTHIHFSPTPPIPLEDLRSVSEILARIADVARNAKPGAWIVTAPIGVPPDYFHLPDSLAEQRWPALDELDTAAPRNPVYIPSAVARPTVAIFNSVALSEIGVTRDTADDALVRIGKDNSGELNGYVYGLVFYSAASPLYQKLSSALPTAPSSEAVLSGIGRGLADYISFGVTSIYAGHGYSPTEFRGQVQGVSSTGQAVPRVVSTYEIPRHFGRMKSPIAEIESWMADLTEGKGAGSGDDMFKILGITVSMDGATQFGRALMHEPYLNPYGEMSNGASSYTTEQLIQIGRLSLKHDLRLNIQAAGNKACEMAVQALEAIHRETPITDKRWVLQHYQHPTRAQLSKLKDMGVVVQTYSAVDFSKGADTYVNRFPGKDVWKSTVPLRWYFDSGVPVSQSTDGRHKNPAFVIWDALMRIDGETGKTLLTPEKTITRREAIEMYTINGARVMHQEDRVGSIEVGKLADFAVFDRDILTVPEEEIKDAKVLLTTLGGEIVHRSSFFDPNGELE